MKKKNLVSCKQASTFSVQRQVHSYYKSNYFSYFLHFLVVNFRYILELYF
jgi:hypothetical protein